MLMLMIMSTLVMLSTFLQRSSSVSWRVESSALSSRPLIGGMREKMLSIDFCFASSNNLASWVRNFPCARRPLLRVLRLLGQLTFLEMKSCSVEIMSMRLSIAPENSENCALALSVAASSSDISVRMGGLMTSFGSSNAAKMILNSARWRSAWDVAVVWVGVDLVGVESLGRESNVRTDWLSGIGGTKIDEVRGVVLFMTQRVLRIVLIALGASQLSLSSSVRP